MTDQTATSTPGVDHVVTRGKSRPAYTSLPPRKAPLRRAVLAPGRSLAAGGGPNGTIPAPRKAPRRTGPSAATLMLILQRDGDRCVLCGIPGTDYDPLVPHHRLNRGMGGSTDPAANSPANIIRIHASENGALEDARGVQRDHAVHAGWKLKRGMHPVSVPVLYPDGRWWLLDNEGGRTMTGRLLDVAVTVR